MSKEQRMQVGVVGLGKMGSIIARRLLRAAHDVSGTDLDRSQTAALEREGLVGRGSLEALVDGLQRPRLVWLMLPSGAAVEAVLDDLAALLQPGDVVVEGGNSDYRDSVERARRLARSGLALLDVGVSGGVWGLEDGCGLLVGGGSEQVARAAPAFDAVAAAGGWAHVGPAGAGHYAKMIHNAVEYGVMEAYAEGYELLRSAPMELDAARTVEVWNAACSIRAWLLGHLATVLASNPGLDGVASWVGDSGQGRWTVERAVGQGVPVPAIAAALFARFASQRDGSPAMQALAALREQVGGHRAQVPA
jgi:6-phosphogluconate dehydrogenase